MLNSSRVLVFSKTHTARYCYSWKSS